MQIVPASKFRPCPYRIIFIACSLLISCILHAQPVISSFTPLSGNAGSTVTISGSNFSTTAANNAVYFGPVKATVTAATTTSLSVTVPAGATYSPVTVTVNGLTAYSLKQFDVTYSGGGQINGSTFQDRLDSTTDLHPNAVVVADLDGDGKPDIATPNNYSITGQPASISVLRNTSASGNISYAPAININNGVLTYALVAADIDGDGKPDLLASSIVDKTISVLRNTSTPGTISFAPKVDLTTDMGVYSITVGDFDNDGKPDVASVGFLMAHVSMFRNTGSPGVIAFSPRVDIAMTGAESITSADLDGDGKTDLAFTNQTLGYFSIMRNTSTAGNFSFAARIEIPCQGTNQPYHITAGDLDGDGKNDLAVTITNSNICGVQLYRNTSVSGTVTMNYSMTLSGPANNTGYASAIGDINGDGKPDMAMTYANGPGQASAYQNTSTPGTISFTYNGSYNAFYAPYGIALCDMDADGKPELSLSNFTLDKVSVFKNRCGSPEITSFFPSSAAAGATITITGTNFNNVTAVTFGTVAAASFTVVNATTITAVVGTGATGDVKVTNNIGSGSKAGFLFQGAPAITSFSPANGFQGTLIHIHGFNFSNATAVSFGGTAAQTFTIVDAFNIDAVVGNGTTGNVSVTNTYGTGSLGGFSYTPIPVPSSFTPTSAATGGTVTISGINFTGTTSVSFGGVNATSLNVVNDNTITAVVGNGASGTIVITNNFGIGSINGFTYIPPPTITSFTPVSAGAGTTVVITGTNLSNATSVKFGGVNALSFTVVNATTINAVVSSNGTSGAVSIVTPGGSASLPGFTFIPAPTITSFSPLVTGTGGVVTITGTNLTGASAVSFGAVAASSFTVVNATTITAVVGSGASGIVSVTTPGGIAELAGFSYITTPFINSFSPASGPVGTTVTITGANFNTVAANNIVYFGAVRANVSSATANTIVVTVPTGATYQPITVTTNNLTAYSSSPFKVTFTGGGAFTAASFAGRTDFVTAGQPESIASGDLDGDGKADVVVANAYSNTLSLYRNTSTATSLSFAVRVDSAAGLYPHAIKLADLNGDGKLDIVYLNFNANATVSGGPDNTVSYFRNTSTAGNISFAPRQYFQTSFYVNPLNLEVVDLNTDGKPDLSVTHTSTYMPNGNPFFTTWMNTSTPSTISFQGAALTEIVIFPNQIFPSSITSADINLDNRPDIVVTTAYGGGGGFNNVVVMKNTSPIGSFISFAQAPAIQNCTSVYNFAYATDFNADNKPDILTDNCFYKNATTASTNIQLVFQPANNLGGTLALDVLSGTGGPDIARVNPVTGTVSAVKNNSTPATTAFDPDVNYNVGTNPAGVSIADFNGDGKVDIAVTNKNFNTFSVLLNSAGATGMSITSFAPNNGTNGTVVTITGSNFTGITGVSFGGVAASSFTVVNSTTITATVAGGTSGNVSVTSASGTASMGWFYYAPTITSFTPTSAGFNLPVTITGTGFTGATAVSFGGVAARSFIIVSPTTIVATVDNGASGNVSVTTPGGTATLAGFTFVAAPTITTFTPLIGFTGTVVTLTGTNFTGATQVTFGGAVASSITVVNATTITAVVGNGASGTVFVTTPGGTGNSGNLHFTFQQPPSITSYSPASAAAGQTVTITGTNFNGATAVSFGGVAATSFTVVSNTSITAVLGTGASGNVQVVTPSGTATAPGFIFNYPTGIGGPGSVNSPDLTVSPNPGSQTVVIRHPVTTTGKGTLRFTDVYGRAVITIQPARNDAQSSVDVGKLSSGVYLIRWSDGKKELTRLFMKE